MGQAVATGVEGGGRRERARELFERALELKSTGQELVLDMAELLKDVRDGGYHKEMGYTTFEAFLDDTFQISKETAHRYIRIAENVLETLPGSVSTRLTFGASALPIKLLAAIRFDSERFTPEVVKRLEGMGDEELKAEVLRLGYDRARMGGRTSSDLLRHQIGKRTYRDQRRRIQLLNEKLECEKGQAAELREQYKELQARLDQVMEAIQNPESAKTIKQMDALTVRIAELEKARAADEAEIATGKEVGTRALILSGEIQALLGKFEDSVRIDKKAQWVEVRAVLHSAQDAIEQTLGRMAEVIIARVDSGEITRFSVEDPEGESGAAALGLSEPRRR